MAAKLDVQVLDLVFQSRPDLLAGIKQAADSPERINLFNQIAHFVYERVSSDETQDGPAAKRRRVEIDQTSTQTHTNGNGASSSNGITSNAAAEQVLLEVKDISVAAPQRKKYSICFTQNYLYASVVGAPVEGIVYAWKDIEHILYLPVPEKSQVQHNYVVLPCGGYLPMTTKAAAGSTAPEPLVFTVPATAPKPGSIVGPSAKHAEAVSDSFSTLFHWALTTSLRSAGNPTSIISSDPKLFHSVSRQAYRPNEKAVHVKGFRGSKDGYLFFLPNGILWGFKKPILFLPVDRIVALSYTNVLRTTFNIVVELDVNENEGFEKEVEFGMLDQEDYQGIDENYVRRYGLADRSMAEQRKAKRQLAENGKKGAAEDTEAAAGGENGGMTELEKASLEEEQRLQDEEDEEEDDYDPGSDGDSDGSGISSEEGSNDDQDAEGDDDEDEEDDLDGDGDGMDED
ncbi:putative chaperone protein [Podospora fimiseda]|uniref:Chaperone protein n=1 Tax=Podospora fimiseda TaxID=252190 RepID=A0AAN7BG49_9PEZI|nr:putative chaperone protein [Podospora fimiseda]